MNIPQMPMQNQGLMNTAYVQLYDILDRVPPDLPLNTTIKDIRGMIPSVIYANNWRYVFYFEGGCGCPLTTAINERQFRRIAGRSWTGQLVCKEHLRMCHKCRVGLCVFGNPDGFFLDDGESKRFLCTPHFEEETKSLKRWNFFNGFLEGFFGGE